VFLSGHFWQHFHWQPQVAVSYTPPHISVDSQWSPNTPYELPVESLWNTPGNHRESSGSPVGICLRSYEAKYIMGNWTQEQLQCDHKSIFLNSITTQPYQLQYIWMHIGRGLFCAYRIWPKLENLSITRKPPSESGVPQFLPFLIKPEHPKH
jgi:hypothetical protein